MHQAAETLPAAAFSLFCRQALPEQRHALDVAKSLKARKIDLNLSAEDYHNLIIAALLHDCGKSFVNIQLWQRIMIVLVTAGPCQFMKNYIINNKNQVRSLALTLEIADRHAEWGESLARKAGLNEYICLLIREHHSPRTELGRILQENDNTN
jgi:HD-like signal output (HDOD) protein